MTAVLVGYASVHGSTAEIAERIAARLAERGHDTEVVSLEAVADVDRHGPSSSAAPATTRPGCPRPPPSSTTTGNC